MLQQTNHAVYTRLGRQEDHQCSSRIVYSIIIVLTILILAGLGFAIWWNLKYNPCRKSLTILMLCIVGLVVIITSFAVLAIATERDIYLHIFMSMAVLFVVAFYIYTFSVLIVAGPKAGHYIPRRRYMEYHLEDWGPLFSKQVKNSRSWEQYKSCIVKSGVCDELVERFENLEMETIILSPVEAGCCRPPYECGYPAINASSYNLTVESGSRNNDCKLYKNSPAVKCYDCDQCKGGVLKNLQKEWLFSTFWIFILAFLTLVGCTCVFKYADGTSFT